MPQYHVCCHHVWHLRQFYKGGGARLGKLSLTQSLARKLSIWPIIPFSSTLWVKKDFHSSRGNYLRILASMIPSLANSWICPLFTIYMTLSAIIAYYHLFHWFVFFFCAVSVYSHVGYHVSRMIGPFYVQSLITGPALPPFWSAQYGGRGMEGEKGGGRHRTFIHL